MFICKYCTKECKNNNSLAQHQIRCKLNPDKIEISYNNLANYNSTIVNKERKGSNQYTKAKKLGLPKPIISAETRKKLGDTNRNRVWTDAERKRQSDIMTETAKKYPLSYSSQNVCGRTKSIDCIDSYGNPTKVAGSWELKVSQELDSLNIKWTNIIEENIIYHWNNQDRRYYPDFYLPDYDIYIEVKGYERERDLKKWEVLTHKLIVLKNKEITQLKKNQLDILELIKNKKKI